MNNTTDNNPQMISTISSTGFLLGASRKEIKAAASVSLAKHNPYNILAMAKRLEAYAKDVIEGVKPILSELLSEGEHRSALGADIYFQGGGFKIKSPESFEHDPEWQRIKAELEAREDLMRAAAKQPIGSVLYDSDGVEVPRAREVQSSPSLNCRF